MKFKQKSSFTIKLETSEEARDFIALIDQVDALHSHAGWEPDKLTKSQKALLKKISDEFTERIGLR